MKQVRRRRTRRNVRRRTRRVGGRWFGKAYDSIKNRWNNFRKKTATVPKNAGAKADDAAVEADRIQRVADKAAEDAKKATALAEQTRIIAMSANTQQNKRNAKEAAQAASNAELEADRIYEELKAARERARIASEMTDPSQMRYYEMEDKRRKENIAWAKLISDRQIESAERAQKDLEEKMRKAAQANSIVTQTKPGWRFWK